ncbi:hypothetical protein HOD29_06220 [archaeon]|jgi:hypothetical protein|nr:hypothetical protein [archaeon]
MIDLKMTFERMKSEINFRKFLVDEVISPVKNPDKFAGFDGLDYLSKNNLTMADCRCISEKYFQNLLRGFWSGTGIEGYLMEMNYNSCMHGNKWDKSLSLHVKMGYGDKGFVFQIKDLGDGFDYRNTVKKFNGGEAYLKNKGSGLIMFNSGKNHVISWAGKGNLSNFMFKVTERDVDLWGDRIWQNENNYFVF